MNVNTTFLFQNTELPLEERVIDLVSRFTLEEKINLMCQYQTEIPRLGVMPYKHGTEGAHGIAWLGEATVFPQNIGLACTWNPDLLREIGSAIGDEARVYFQRNPAINGLTIWAPTVDMERDPRWGRTEEAYGEDPYLTGRISTELVKGMQGPHPFYLKAVATLKHFLGNNNEIDRGECSVSIDPRNMREYYLKAFEAAFTEGGAQSMMTAYNAINGTLCNLNPDVNEIVKGEWGMNGFVVSDAGDVLGTVRDHKHMHSYAEAVAESIKNGIDSITDDQEISLRAIRDALEQGLLSEEDLDLALRNTFRVRFRLGEFDPEESNPYANTPESKLCAPEHAELSLRAARESIVLLKNDGALPLKSGLERIAVIGPLANTVYTDWYSGTPAYRITFQRVHLLPGQSEAVTFTLPIAELSFWDVTRDRYCVESGAYTVMVGSSSGSLLMEASFSVYGETIPPRKLDAPVRAANYDDYEGVYLDACREGDGASLRNQGAAGWIAFRGADLGSGVDVFEARVAQAEAGAKIEIRLDAPDGLLVGICTVPPTGGWQAWTTVKAALSGAAGIRDVYLRFEGTVQISWFRLYSGS